MVKKKKEKFEHINYNWPAKTHTSMYLMHKYWARKPANVVAEYIKHYSKEGETVLDPFAGSGVTAVEAIKLRRKGIEKKDINKLFKLPKENRQNQNSLGLYL